MLQWLNLVAEPELLDAGLAPASAAAILAHRAAAPNNGRFTDLSSLPPEASTTVQAKMKAHLCHLQQNWVKGALCLRAALCGLPSFIEEHGKAMMRDLQSAAPAGDPSVGADYYGGVSHDQQVPAPDPSLSPVPKCSGTVAAPVAGCSGCIRNVWAEHIQQRHAKGKKGKMGWGNSKISSWNGTEDDYFEVLKAFCGTGGYKSIASPDQGDATLLGNIMNWCIRFHLHLPPVKANDFKSSRNSLMHHPMQLLTDEELKKLVGNTSGYSGNILRLLKDNTAPSAKSLSENALAKQAVTRIYAILGGAVDSTARIEALEMRSSELKADQQVLAQAQDQLRLELDDKVACLEHQFSALSSAFNAIKAANGATENLAQQLSAMDLSKGDLGYFFPRADDVGWLQTGSIVALCGGQLMRPSPELAASNTKPIFLVVSDDCVLVRAGRQPMSTEEGLNGTGHWVAWVGQVPTKVSGPVTAGDWIGAAEGGGHVGVRVAAGSTQAVGIALETWVGPGEGHVLTGLSFAQSTIGHAINSVEGMLADQIGALEEEMGGVQQREKRRLENDIEELLNDIDDGKQMHHLQQEAHQRKLQKKMQELEQAGGDVQQLQLRVGVKRKAHESVQHVDKIPCAGLDGHGSNKTHTKLRINGCTLCGHDGKPAAIERSLLLSVAGSTMTTMFAADGGWFKQDPEDGLELVTLPGGEHAVTAFKCVIEVMQTPGHKLQMPTEGLNESQTQLLALVDYLGLAAHFGVEHLVEEHVKHTPEDCKAKYCEMVCSKLPTFSFLDEVVHVDGESFIEIVMEQRTNERQKKELDERRLSVDAEREMASQEFHRRAAHESERGAGEVKTVQLSAADLATGEFGTAKGVTVVTGLAGWGKTSLQRHIGTLLARDPKAQMLPIFVRCDRVLAELGKAGATGTEAIVLAATHSIELGTTEQHRMQRYLQGALQRPATKVVLLMDAFDEVGSLDMRKELFNTIQRKFCGDDDGPIGRVVLTSRPGAFQGIPTTGLQGSAIHVVKIMPLAPTRACRFVTALLTSWKTPEAIIESVPNLTAKCSNASPVLLFFVAKLLLAGRELHDEGGKLYEQILELMISKRCADRMQSVEASAMADTRCNVAIHLARSGIEIIIQLLSLVGYLCHTIGSQESEPLVSKRRLLHELEKTFRLIPTGHRLGLLHTNLCQLVQQTAPLCCDDGAVLGRLVDALGQVTGLFVERTEGHMMFDHRTLQEYLAARFLTDSAWPLETKTGFDWAGERFICSSWWRKVYIFAASLHPGDAPLAAMAPCSIDEWCSGIEQSVTDPSDVGLKRFELALQMSSNEDSHKDALAKALSAAINKEPNVGLVLLSSSGFTHPAVTASVGVVLAAARPARGLLAAIETMQGMGAAAAPYAGQMVALLQDEDSGVRRSAARALRKMGAAAAPYAGQIAALLQHEDSGVRESAAGVLGVD